MVHPEKVIGPLLSTIMVAIAAYLMESLFIVVVGLIVVFLSILELHLLHNIASAVIKVEKKYRRPRSDAQELISALEPRILHRSSRTKKSGRMIWPGWFQLPVRVVTFTVIGVFLVLVQTWAIQKTPIYGLFVNEYESAIMAEMEASACSSYQIAEKMLLDDEKITKGFRVFMVNQAFNDYLRCGDDQSTVEQRRAVYSAALEWATPLAEEYGLDLAAAERGLNLQEVEVIKTQTVFETVQVEIIKTQEVEVLITPTPQPTLAPAFVDADLFEIISYDDSNYPLGVIRLRLSNGGNPVEGLVPEDFRIDLDGQPVEVLEAVSVLLNPVSRYIAVAIDISGSMLEFNRLEQVKVAFGQFVTQLTPQDKVRIVSFNHQVNDSGSWVSPQEALEQVQSLQAGGDTALFSAIAEASRLLAVQNGSKVLVVMSDGEDTASTILFTDSLEVVSTSKISFYGISAEGPTEQLDQLANTALEGYVVSVSADASQLDAVFAALGQSMRAEWRVLVTAVAQNPNEVRVRVGSNHIEGVYSGE